MKKKYGIFKCKDCSQTFSVELHDKQLIRCPSVSHGASGGWNVKYLGGG